MTANHPNLDVLFHRREFIRIAGRGFRPDDFVDNDEAAEWFDACANLTDRELMLRVADRADMATLAQAERAQVLAQMIGHILGARLATRAV